MENAVQELMQENNGGVLVWFLEILWAQAKRNENDPQASYYADFPSIPHSVVFNYSHAQGWFFEPSSAKPGTRRIRRKRRQHLGANDIFAELTSGFDVSNKTLIVAQLVTRLAPHAPLPRFSYLTRDDLYQLLFHGTIAEGSILQRFVYPQGPNKDPMKNFNSVLSITWQPSYCFVERHVNQIPLDDPTSTVKERAATIEEARNTTVTALRHGSTTLHRCRRACNAIAEHVRVATGLHLRSLTCITKINEMNELSLLFVQRVAVVENAKLTPSIVPRSKSATFHSDGDEEDDAATHSVAQRERQLELRRCGSAQQRHYLRSLLPEEDADRAFDSIAPRSWNRSRESATRFQGNRVLSAPGNVSSLRSTPMINSAARRSRAFSTFHDSVGRAPRSGTSIMREIESEMTMKSQGSIVVSSDWNDEATRLEVALMREATTDLFALKKVAHHVSALGLREKYLASMRAASQTRPQK